MRIGVAVAVGLCACNPPDNADDGPGPPDAPNSCNVYPGADDPSAPGAIQYILRRTVGVNVGTFVAHDVAVRSDGDFFLAGDEVEGPNTDMMLERNRSNGCRRIGSRWGDLREQILAIDTYPDGSPVMVGRFEWSIFLTQDGALTGNGFDGVVFKIETDHWAEFAHVLTATGDGERLVDVAVSDDGGKTIVIGTFEGAAAFGSEAVSSDGGADIFVARLGPTGGVLWTRSFGGTGDDLPHAVAITPDGHVVVVGQTDSDSIDFGGGPLAWAPANPEQDGFIAVFDADTGHVWSKRFAGGAQDVAHAVASDSSGIYIGGSYGGSVDFGAGTVTSAAGDLTNGYVAKYSHTGALLWLTELRSSSPAAVHGLAANATRVVLTGVAEDVATIDGQPIVGGTRLVSGLDPSSGSLAWVITGDGPSGEAAVAMRGGRVLVAGAFQGPLNMGGVGIPAASIGTYAMAITP